MPKEVAGNGRRVRFGRFVLVARHRAALGRDEYERTTQSEESADNIVIRLCLIAEQPKHSDHNEILARRLYTWQE